jgi:oligopeptide transport system substrate-binding protein
MKFKRLNVITIALLLLCQASWAASLRRGLGPEPDSLDIHQAQGLPAIHLLREIREGLFTFDAAGEVAAGVAGAWTVLEDGRLWRFELRENARWSNGDPVLAEDFVRGWRRALAPGTAARNAKLLTLIEHGQDVLSGASDAGMLGVTATGSHGLELRLSEPTPWLPEILAHPVSFPLHPQGVDDPAGGPVNGAFMIARMTPQALIALVPNPHFHSAAEVRLDSVEFYPIADPAAELSRYRAGELDITENIPPGRYAWLQENHGPDLRVSAYLGSFWLGLNLSREPFSGKAALRQALSLAIDRETLVRVVLGAGELSAWSVVPPGLEGHQPWRPAMANLSREEREAEARRLFAQSGHAPGTPLRIELRYNSSSQHRRMAIAVAAMWKQVLGVATELINEEWKVFVNNRQQRVLTQVFRGGWIADYADPASFLDLFHSVEALNWSAYANPQYDQLLEQARQQSGARRMALLQQAEVVLMRDMPVIPLYYYVSRHLVRPGVEGYIDNLRDIHLSRYMDISEPRP